MSDAQTEGLLVERLALGWHLRGSPWRSRDWTWRWFQCEGIQIVVGFEAWHILQKKIKSKNVFELQPVEGLFVGRKVLCLWITKRSENGVDQEKNLHPALRAQWRLETTHTVPVCAVVWFSPAVSCLCVCRSRGCSFLVWPRIGIREKLWWEDLSRIRMPMSWQEHRGSKVS